MTSLLPRNSPFLTFAEDRDFDDDWVRAASRSLDLAALCDLVVVRCLQVFPGQSEDGLFAAHLRSSVTENLQTLQRLFCGETDLESLRLRDPVTFAVIQAEMDSPHTSLQRSYRVSFATIWDQWTAALIRESERLAIAPSEVIKVLGFATRAIFTYHDFVTSAVAESYAEVDEALSRSRSHLRQQIVREILERPDRAPEPADLLSLEYDVTAHHIAVRFPQTTDEVAARMLGVLREAAKVRSSLRYRTSLESTIVWLGNAGPWRVSQMSRLRTALEGLRLPASLSDPRPGLAGLVDCYRQTESIEGVRRLDGSGGLSNRVLSYGDVLLDVLLTQDRSLAEAFVRRELRGLADVDAASARLCETLEASLQYGSHTATAEALGVHEHTVRNRLRRAEELLGGSFRSRRAELEVALRLRRLFSGPYRGA